MKLIRMISRIYNGTKYYKFRVNIPGGMISELRWDGGEELNCTIKKIGNVKGLFISLNKLDQGGESKK